jgi:hypothetical protein
MRLTSNSRSIADHRRANAKPDPLFNPVAYAQLVYWDVDRLRAINPIAFVYDVIRFDLPLCDRDLNRACEELFKMGVTVTYWLTYDDAQGTSGCIQIEPREEGNQFEPARHALAAVKVAGAPDSEGWQAIDLSSLPKGRMARPALGLRVVTGGHCGTTEPDRLAEVLECFGWLGYEIEEHEKSTATYRIKKR